MRLRGVLALMLAAMLAPMLVMPGMALAKPAAPAGGAANTGPRLGAWASHVEPTAPGGFRLGKPDAALKIVEYMSYTCPHCAHFEAEGAPRLKLTLISQGKASLEIRHSLHGPVDLAVALLTHCGGPARFFGLHSLFLARQEEWTTLWQHATGAQTARWQTRDEAASMRAIASDLKFYDLVEPLGLSRVQADRCLADKAMMNRIAAQSAEAETIGVTGTPSFTLNGTLLIGTYDWSTLAAQLQARL